MGLGFLCAKFSKFVTVLLLLVSTLILHLVPCHGGLGWRQGKKKEQRRLVRLVCFSEVSRFVFQLADAF